MNPNEQALKLLFVDDEKRILIPLKALFRNQYDVSTTTNPVNALEMVKSESIDIIVSDHRMPEMTGAELLRQVRDVSPKTVRILLTGYADLDSVMGAVNSSEVFRFVEKPWNNERLKTTLAEASELARGFAQLSDSDLSLEQPSDDADDRESTLLVIDSTQDIYQMLVSSFSDRCHVIHNHDLQSGMASLNAYPDVTALIIDVPGKQSDVAAFIHALKRSYPLIPILASAREADANVIIQLINEGQIFRYLPKPITQGMLKLSVGAACRLNQSYSNPKRLALLAKQNVEDSGHRTVSDFMEQMKDLKDRFRQRLNSLLRHG